MSLEEPHLVKHPAVLVKKGYKREEDQADTFKTHTEYKGDLGPETSSTCIRQ